MNNIHTYTYICSFNVVFMWFYCTPGAVSDEDASDDGGKYHPKQM